MIPILGRVTPARFPASLRGILLMCAGVAMFPFLNASAKLLTAGYPVSQILWARFTIHLALMLIAFVPRRGWRVLVAHRPGLHAARSFLLFGSTSFYVSAIGQVPLATASAIGFTAPLIVTCLSVPLLGEPVGPRRWAAVAIGFLGALVVIRPHSGLDNAAALLVLGSTGCYALYQLVTRKVGTTDAAETGIIYAALAGAVVMSFVLPFTFKLPVRPLDWALFLCPGLFGGFGHYLIVRAFQDAPAALLSPFGYLELIGTTILGYLIFGNFPDGWTWVGVAVILASGAYVAYRERRVRERRSGSGARAAAPVIDRAH